MKEVKPILAMYGFRGKQAYIYKTNRIKEVAGASQIIKYGFKYLYESAEYLGYKIKTKKAKQENGYINYEYEEKFDINTVFTDKDDSDGVEIYEGGGNLFILYRNKEIASSINRKFTRKLIKETYSLKASYAFVELGDGNSWRKRNYKNDQRELFKNNEIIESQEPLLEPYGILPFVRVDDRTSQPIGYMIDGMNTEKRKNKDVSIEANLKLYNYKDSKGTKLLDDYVTKKGEESLLAIIYIDGNNMGNKVKSRLDKIEKEENYNECVEILRKFSAEIDEKYIKKGLCAIERKLEELQNKEKGLKNDKEKNYRFGYREIIAAGDEITIICNAAVAFEIAVAYLKSLESESSNYSSCAGISIFHSHDPYANAYKIAEKCCESAKEISHEHKAKECCLLDFHFCHSGIATSLDEIRTKDEVGISRPWLISSNFDMKSDEKEIFSIEDVYKMKEQLDKIARSSRMALTEAAIMGKSEFERELERIIANAENVIDSNILNEKNRKLIYDMGLVYDLWFREED